MYKPIIDILKELYKGKSVKVSQLMRTSTTFLKFDEENGKEEIVEDVEWDGMDFNLIFSNKRYLILFKD